nr:hypothetical protein [uncultured Erwinia sp.]
MKDNFIALIESRSHSSVDSNDLSIDYETDLDKQLERYLTLLSEQEALLAFSKSTGNDLSMLSALLKLRTHAMSLSSFFDAIVEDAEIILKLNNWPEISDE